MKLTITCPICANTEWTRKPMTTVESTQPVAYVCTECGAELPEDILPYIPSDTQNKTSTTKKERAKPVKKTVARLMDISNDVLREQEAQSDISLSKTAKRNRFRHRLIELRTRILAEFTKTDLTQKVKDIMENENYHDIVMIIDIIHGRDELEDLVQKYGEWW